MNFTFSKYDRIRKSREYSDLKVCGKVFKTKRLVFNYRRSKRSRLGVIVTKKVGNSVVRSRVKRWVREVFRTEKHAFVVPLELIVIPRCSDLSYQDIKRDFVYFVGKCNEKTAHYSN